MENAAKALLIAASVFASIFIIALGMLIVRSVADTSKQADETGKMISNATDEAIRSYQKIYITAEEYNEFISNISARYSNSIEFIDVIGVHNSRIRNQIEICCYTYQALFSEWSEETDPQYKKINGEKFSAKWIKSEKYTINTFIPGLIAKGRVKQVPLSNEQGAVWPIVNDLYEVYKKNKDESATMATFRANADMTIRYYFDIASDGYISKICMVGVIKSW